MRESGFPVELLVVRDGQEAVDYLMRQGPMPTARSAQPRPDLARSELAAPDRPASPRAHPRHAGAEDRAGVVLTTSRRQEDVQDMYAAGANTYIEKPQDFHALCPGAANDSALLARHGAAAARQLMSVAEPRPPGSGKETAPWRSRLRFQTALTRHGQPHPGSATPSAEAVRAFWYGLINYEQRTPPRRSQARPDAGTAGPAGQSASAAAHRPYRRHQGQGLDLGDARLHPARAGYRTGLFTSPHLGRVEERFQVDGQPISARRADGVAGRGPRVPSAGTATRQPAADLLRGGHGCRLLALCPPPRRGGRAGSRVSAAGSIRPTCASRWCRSSPASASTTPGSWATTWP